MRRGVWVPFGVSVLVGGAASVSAAEPPALLAEPSAADAQATGDPKPTAAEAQTVPAEGQTKPIGKQKWEFATIGYV